MSLHGVWIEQTGGILTEYVVRDNRTGQDLFVGATPLLGKLEVKIWCLLHGHGWPTAQDMNGRSP